MYDFPIEDRFPTTIEAIFSYHRKQESIPKLLLFWIQQLLKSKSFTNTINISEISILDSYINHYIHNNLIPAVSSTYSFSKYAPITEFIYKINNIYFELGEINNNTFQTFQKDDSNITARILIQKYSDNCSMTFDDRVIYNLHEGDIVIYSDKSQYCIDSSDKQQPIFLVFNIDIYSESVQKYYSTWGYESNNSYKDCV